MTAPSDQPAPPSVARWARLVGITLTIIVIALMDVGAGYLRARRRGTAAPVVPAAELERVYRAANPRYHHDLKPNMTTDSAVWGPMRYSVATNSLGFKDARVRDVPLADSRYRILFIGDSFTEGDGYPFEATYVGLIASRLEKQGIEVLNAGVSGYSPAMYWRKVEDLLVRRGLQVDTVVVFIDISDTAEEALGYRLDANGNVVDAPPSQGWWWTRNSMLYRALRSAALTYLPRDPIIGCGRSEFGSVTCKAAWTTSPTIMRAWGNDGLARADHHMTQLAALLRARQIPLTVAVYPWPQQLTAGDRSSIQVTFWQTWAQREGAQFIQMFDAFFAQVDALSMSGAIERHFISGDVHWNDKGHELVASEFLARYSIPAVGRQ